MWNYINMLANHVRLLQSSCWRHSLAGGNSDSNCWVCLLSKAQQDGSRWGFRAFSLEAAIMLWTWMALSSRTKKKKILLATHPDDSVFRFKWPFLCCFIIKCAAFSGCRSIQITLKGPGEGLHILYSRCHLRYTSLLQVRTMQDSCLSVSVLMCTHFCSQI